jgi:hypothetical protein
MDVLEQVAADIAARSIRPRDQRHASQVLNDIQGNRDRMLGTGDL